MCLVIKKINGEQRNMTEKEKLEVIKHSYEVLQSLVKDLTERVKDAKDGIATLDQNLIIGIHYSLIFSHISYTYLLF